MNIKTIGLPFTTVNTCTAAPGSQFIPVTQWMSPAEFQRVRATMELRAKCGDIRVSVAYQVADVENSPTGNHEIQSYNGAPPTGYQHTESVHYPQRWDGLIEANSVSSVLCRFGFLVQNDTGGSLSSARVAAKIEVFTA